MQQPVRGAVFARRFQTSALFQLANVALAGLFDPLPSFREPLRESEESDAGNTKAKHFAATGPKRWLRLRRLRWTRLRTALRRWNPPGEIRECLGGTDGTSLIFVNLLAIETQPGTSKLHPSIVA